jgi:HEPN domain-containing protein
MQSDEYRLWFKKAEDNLLWAKGNLEEGFYPLVCFLSQQAVEIALKGFLYSKDLIPPKIHNLVKIFDVCSKSGLKLSKAASDGLDILTDYYFETRYPDMLNNDLNNENVAKTAIESAVAIVKVVVDSV